MTTARLLLILILGFTGPALGVEAGGTAPSFKRFDANGSLVRYPPAEAHGKSVVLFWATWCPYCQALMPYLDGIARDYAEQGVRIYAINMKETDDARGEGAGPGRLIPG